MQVTGNVIERSIEGPTRAKLYAFGQGWTVTVAGEDFASIKCGSFYRITLEEVKNVSNIDFHAEAQKAWAAHSGGVMMAGADAAAGPGILALLFQLLSGMGLDWSKIVGLAVKIVPLIIAKDWAGVLAAIMELLKPVNPNGPTLP